MGKKYSSCTVRLPSSFTKLSIFNGSCYAVSYIDERNRFQSLVRFEYEKDKFDYFYGNSYMDLTPLYMAVGTTGAAGA